MRHVGHVMWSVLDLMRCGSCNVVCGGVYEVDTIIFLVNDNHCHHFHSRHNISI